MGQQISVETLCAKDEDCDGRYWCSFEPYPYKVGNKKLCYMGILNGKGPRRGDRCLVKAFRNACGTKSDWSPTIQRAKLAKTYCAIFNKELAKLEQNAKLIFHIPMLVEIDEVSSYMCIALLLGKPRKKMRELEFVLMEPYFRGRFQSFDSNKTNLYDSAITNAFSHFTWYISDGTCVVCKLKGVRNFESYHFTVPVIHSQERKFGENDLGRMGIENFFANHQCNNFCRHLPRLDELPSFCGKTKELEMQSLAFRLQSEGFLKTENENENRLDSCLDRSSPLHTVHCSQPNHCVCEYFRLPCPHRTERTSGMMYAINRCYTHDRSI